MEEELVSPDFPRLPVASGQASFEKYPIRNFSLNPKPNSRQLMSRYDKSKRESGSNSMVESQPSKLLVASSILVSRSRFS